MTEKTLIADCDLPKEAQKVWGILQLFLKWLQLAQPLVETQFNYVRERLPTKIGVYRREESSLYLVIFAYDGGVTISVNVELDTLFTPKPTLVAVSLPVGAEVREFVLDEEICSDLYNFADNHLKEGTFELCGLAHRIREIHAQIFRNDTGK